ncbi:hypothetical protein HDE_00778 [Halotydeus destructor]|nr:hypothetical protein HDE_00778 [Halotydeus destructor]
MSQYCSTATVLSFVALVNLSLAQPAVDWRAGSGFTSDAVEQFKASITAKLDHIKVSFQDWKRDEVDGLVFVIAVKKAEVAVNHELMKAASKVMAFYSDMQERGFLSDKDTTKLKDDLLAAVDRPYESLLQALSSMNNALTTDKVSKWVKGTEKQVESVVESTKVTILDIVDEVYEMISKIMSAKFDP